MEYRILDQTGQPIAARIEINGNSLSLHSRGGPTGGRPARNEGHSLALIQVVSRVKSGAIPTDRILIDSTTAHKLPESERILVREDEIAQLGPADLARAIRTRVRKFGQAPGAKGGNSTKQVRFDFKISEGEIAAALSLRLADGIDDSTTSKEATVARLTMLELGSVTPLHIRDAVDRLLAGEDAPNFAKSRDYDVIVTDGKRLPPKKVFGLAIEAALGIEAFPAHFSAGWSQPCFRLIQEAGFQIVAKQEATANSPVASTNDLPADMDERAWVEGNPTIATHLRTERRRDPRAAAAKRRQVRAANGGRLACENGACSVDWYSTFPPAIAESVFEIHHTTPVAAMRPGHQTVVAELVCLCASCHRAEHRRMSLGL
ncbi:HNH endonuclease [uncultured Sphingomonas sp.]|uniref:HNH endonuclease n=1 Tax=uncultured Sphingomonas sp. TaxID=158754 RepID=UPI0025E712F6|nr:HNH endonuclease [uncultured Sphingomonas sp.]